MNTKILMILSALLMGVCGLTLLFFTEEVLNYLHISSAGGVSAQFVQILAALYLGFAMMNWMAKTVLIGGIYARPLAIGNLSHFLIGALALLKCALSIQNSLTVWIATAIYSVFAILFGFVFFSHPRKSS